MNGWSKMTHIQAPALNFKRYFSSQNSNALLTMPWLTRSSHATLHQPCLPRPPRKPPKPHMNANDATATNTTAPLWPLLRSFGTPKKPV